MANELVNQTGNINKGNSTISGSTTSFGGFTGSLSGTASVAIRGIDGFNIDGALNNGSGNYVLSSYSHAEGLDCTCWETAHYSHVEGLSTGANGIASHAEGRETTANGSGSHAEGYICQSDGDYSHAEGALTIAGALQSHAEGLSTGANGVASHTEGQNTLATGVASHAEGYICQSDGDYSHAEGALTITSGSYSHAEGIYTIASGSGQLACGRYNAKNNTSSLVVIGNGGGSVSRNDLAQFNSQSIVFNAPLTITNGGVTGSLYGSASAINADIINVPNGLVGIDSNGYISGSLIPLRNTYANISAIILQAGEAAYATDRQTYYVGNGTSSVAELFARYFGPATSSVYAELMPFKFVQGGGSNQAIGTGSHAQGNATIASGSYSHAEGNSCKSHGSYGHAEGSSTNANGESSHAEGQICTATGNYSHVEGQGTSTTGQHSHAEGAFSYAIGDASHAEGAGARSNGYCSHAEGNATIASGSYSHAEGLGTIASGSSQLVCGRYNIGNTSSLVIIGNGGGTVSRNDLAQFNSQSIVFNAPLTITNGGITSSLYGSASYAPIDTAFSSSIATGKQNTIVTGSSLPTFTGSLYKTATTTTELYNNTLYKKTYITTLYPSYLPYGINGVVVRKTGITGSGGSDNRLYAVYSASYRINTSYLNIGDPVYIPSGPIAGVYMYSGSATSSVADYPITGSLVGDNYIILSGSLATSSIVPNNHILPGKMLGRLTMVPNYNPAMVTITVGGDSIVGHAWEETIIKCAIKGGTSFYTGSVYGTVRTMYSSSLIIPPIPWMWTQDNFVNIGVFGGPVNTLSWFGSAFINPYGEINTTGYDTVYTQTSSMY